VLRRTSGTQSDSSGWRAGGLGAALVLALYLETRLWLVERFPHFLDEGILAYYAELGRDPNLRLISLDEGVRPGLVWMTLAGMRLHLDPFVAIRVASVLFGLVALACGTVLAWRYLGKVAAGAFAALALVTPYLFLYTSLGLRDPVIAGLMVAGLLFEIELARTPRLAFGVPLGLTFALDLLVKESGKAAIYLLPVSLVYFPFRSPQRLRLALTWILNACVALTMAVVATLPLRLSSSYFSLGATEREIGYTRSFSSVLAHPLRYLDQSWPGVQGELTSYLTYPIMVAAFIGLGLGLRRRPRFTALIAVWAIAQIASVVWLAANLDARYLVPSVPFVLLLAATGVQEVFGLVRGRIGSHPRVTMACGLVGALLLVPALVFDGLVSYDPASAPYPPDDKTGFITGFTSGIGVNAAIGELKVLANGQPLDVLSDPNHAYETFELAAILQGVNINWIWTSDPGANTAALLANGTPVPSGAGRFREIWSYQRPDGGVPITISVHG
jgi:hypothetical protein